MKKIKIKKSHMSYASKIGAFATSLLMTATAIYLYSPVSGTHAETASELIELNVNPGIGLVVSADDVEMESTIGSFVHDTIDVDVITNSQYGYTLTLEDSDADTDLIASNAGVDVVITSNFSGSKTSDTMENNSWGFSIDNENYYKMPVKDSPVAIKRVYTAPENSFDTTPVDFGIKIGFDAEASDYLDSIIFTAYVNGQDGKPTIPGDPDNPPADPDDHP